MLLHLHMRFISTVVTPTTLNGDFILVAKQALVLAQQQHQAVMYGDPQLNLPYQPPTQEQMMLMEGNICHDNAYIIRKHMPNIHRYGYIVDQCTHADGGILTLGLSAGIYTVLDAMHYLTSELYRGVFMHATVRPGPIINQELYDQAYPRFKAVSTLLLDFVGHILVTFTSMILDAGQAYVSQQQWIALVIYACYVCLVIGFYIAAMRPMGRKIGQSAMQNKSMLLLIPNDILLNVLPIRMYIREHVKDT